MNKYHKITITMVFVIIVLLIMIVLDPNIDKERPANEEQNLDNNNDSFEEVPYDNPKTVSKSLAVKMVALIKEGKNEIEVRDSEITYEDCKKTDWFEKYFNVAIIEGWFKPIGNRLNPLDPLTNSEAKVIAEHFKIDLESKGITIGEKTDEAISYEIWMALFNALISLEPLENQPKEMTLNVFATPTISTELAGWEIATDKGKFGFEGITIDGCINKEILTVTKGQELLYIKEITKERPILSNAYVIQMNHSFNEADVFMGGVTRKLKISEEVEFNDKKAFIADIELRGNTIFSIHEKNKMTKGVISKISKDEVEIQGIGKMKLSGDSKFYDIVQKPVFTDYTAIVVGYDTATFVLDENQVVAAVIREKAKIEDIRVLITTTGFKDMFHNNVILKSGVQYRLKNGGNDISIEAGKETDVSKLNLAIGQRVIFTPSEGQKIQLMTVKRGSDMSINPQYRGVIEVERVKEGYLIVNELDLEAYLYSVVPSEMPTSYGLEAAKVQAVCARSYAYNQIYSNRFCDYGAHVDDSTTCQVYNNSAETEISIQAVNATKGQLLAYKDNVISANFFSTSCGMTANAGDVWGHYATKEFPATSDPYLVSAYQNDKGSVTGDLSKEEDFKKFITNKTIPSFDAKYPWYRWTTTMSDEQISASINKMIGSRYKAQPLYIKTLDSAEIFRSREVSSIGDIIDIWIYSRGDSGVITELVLQGTKGVYKISTEYNIRALIAPTNYIEGGKSVVITKNDGSTSKDMKLMPSAYYIMEKKYDNQNKLESVTFLGGGYGHGVGMSQNGAKTMVDLGYTYEEILKHYYQGTELISLNK